MPAVYKSLLKTNGDNKPDKPDNETEQKKNKQRVLILSSRGVTYRQRHLLNDIYTLLPHSRKDAKLDTKTKLYQLNELAELYNCNNVLFFEARKGKDLYVWMSKPPNGPTVKMHLQNLHTMSELHFPGNCLRGSRPILSFSSEFTSAPHLLLIQELLTHTFGVPKGARKSKPFIDHVLSFTLADNKIWIRCFQISETAAAASSSQPDPSSSSDHPTTSNQKPPPTKPKSKSKSISLHNDNKTTTKLSLVEIGPRFVLTPIVILESSFGGPVIYENKEFVSPNQIRSEIRRKKAGRYNDRTEQGVDRDERKGALGLRTGVGERERDELSDGVLFA